MTGLYREALKTGVPAMRVFQRVDSARSLADASRATAKVVCAEKSGEFESMRKMDPRSVNDFLRKWQGKVR